MTATLTNIYQAMVDLENASLTAVHSGFTAVKRMPREVPTHPFAFRLPASGLPTGRETSGRKGVATLEQFKPKQWFEYYLKLVILVGWASNDLDALDELANAFVLPVYDLYAAHFKVPNAAGQPTVERLEMGVFEIGEYKPSDTAHYGVIFSMTAVQFQRRAVSAIGG